MEVTGNRITVPWEERGLLRPGLEAQGFRGQGLMLAVPPVVQCAAQGNLRYIFNFQKRNLCSKQKKG